MNRSRDKRYFEAFHSMTHCLVKVMAQMFHPLLALFNVMKGKAAPVHFF